MNLFGKTKLVKITVMDRFPRISFGDEVCLLLRKRKANITGFSSYVTDSNRLYTEIECEMSDRDYRDFQRDAESEQWIGKIVDFVHLREW